MMFFLCTSMLLTVFYSCKTDNKETNMNSDDSLELEIPKVKSGNFYTIEPDSGNSIILADTIIYYTIIKNPYEDDTWQEKCLSRLDRKGLTNIIFNAIYNGRLTPYDFKTETPITIKEVREIEKKFSRDDAAKVEFTEEWYFNETEMTFTKRVNAIMIGYERKGISEEVKYYPGVKVYLNGEKKKIN
jgi:hypothetical protein